MENTYTSNETFERHLSLNTVCQYLHDMIVGQQASELLKDPTSLPNRASLWVTPSWSWLLSRIDVGHKGVNSDGEKVLLPVRITWSTGPLLLSVEKSITTSYAIAGMGHTTVGDTVIESVASERIATPWNPTSENKPPTNVKVERHYRKTLITKLQHLAQQGEQSKWDLIALLHPYVDKAVNSAHKYVSAEVTPNGQPVLDETGLEHVITQIMYGDESSSVILNMIERCTLPSTFLKVDPWMYMRRSIGSAAESAIRRSINDPHVGRKVRRVADELGTRDVETVLNEYQKRYPKDRLAKRRAENALSAGSDAMAVWIGLPEMVPLEERGNHS